MQTIESMMEELGISDLSANERAVLLAMSAAAKSAEDGAFVCHTEDARAHPLASRLSQPTFHRNLKTLLERGLVVKDARLPPGQYRVMPDIVAAARG